MIAGLVEVRKLACENSGDVALVVSHSGEKDSMRMLGVLQRELPEDTYAGCHAGSASSRPIMT